MSHVSAGEGSIMKVWLKELARTAKLYAAFVPFAVMCGIPSYCSGRIESQKQLDSLVVAESAKLGIDHEKISAEFEKTPMAYPASVYGPGDGTYRIRMNSPGTIGFLRHELYHIYDCDFSIGEDNYGFIEKIVDEFQATLK